MTMIRKQLYIDPQQDAALKRKARDLGLSEAELVRRALDAALLEPQHAITPHRSVLQALLEDAVTFSRTHRPNDGYVYNREDAYTNEPRLERWGRN
jgi:Ribbon-helix-helix protein, copG family